MTLRTTTIIGLSVNITLAVLATALLLLVIWHDPRRRSNQYFGLCMGWFALYGAVNTLWQVPQQFALEPRPLLDILATTYIAGLIMLFNFTIAFAGLPRRIRRVEHLISLPIALIFLALLWTDRMFTDFTPLPGGSYSYRVTPAGMIGVGIALAYLSSSMVLIAVQRSPRAQELAVPVTVLGLGVGLFAAVPLLREVAVNGAALIVAVVMMGRLLLKHQVFQPLADLNQQLALKNDELAEATRAKSQFLANMSHELRTPLNSIIGYTELVTHGTYGDLNPLQEDRLHKVTRNGRMLLELINDVLDLSKIEAGRLDLSFGSVATGALLESVLADYEPQISDKGLKLVRGYGSLPALWVDEARARQILRNLLSNAVKFTERGTIIVRGHFDAQERRVVISVTDTGIGIHPNDQERIFDAFQRASGSVVSREHEGTGLGLAIARRLTELHGGRLWFESVPGRGSTFHVALPIAGEALEETAVLWPGARADGPVILAVDDDPDSIEVLQGHLEAHRFRVYGTYNPNNGLEMAHELRPALITLDIRMAGVDGWQVLEALRGDPDTMHIPVLIITAADDPGSTRRAGVDGLITKPVNPQQLLQEVRRLLAEAQAGQENRS